MLSEQASIVFDPDYGKIEKNEHGPLAE